MVKFGEGLKFNGLPDWRDHYINYELLKQLIYDQEERIRLTRLQSANKGDPDPAQPLLQDQGDNFLRSGSLRRSLSLVPEEQELSRPPLRRTTSVMGDDVEGRAHFRSLLLGELNRIANFYDQKEREVLAQVSLVTEKIRSAEIPGRQHPAATREAAMQWQDPESGEDEATQARVRCWAQDSMEDQRDKLQQQLMNAFVEVDNLQKFLQYNSEGFRKATKKWDKVVGDRLQPAIMDKVNEQLNPQQNGRALEAILKTLTVTFAIVVCKGDQRRADRDLHKQLRVQLEYERDTVWRDMAALERRRAAVRVVQPGGDAQPATAWQRWYGQYRQALALVFSLGIFAVLLVVRLYPEPTKQNCLALLALVSLLWCTEALPLYITSALVPFLAVVLRVLVDDSTDPPRRLTAPEAAPKIFHAMFSQVIMLLLGGFAIAGALTKHLIAKATATAILSRSSRKPGWVLAAFMGVASFASMWVSNVAAPVLCFSLLEPLLRVYHPGNPVSKSLVMGIALASNLGGMTSPISSPQNIFAIERMSMGGSAPSWLQWFAIALPVALVGNVLCWALLCLRYRPWRTVRELEPLKAYTDPWNRTQLFVMAVSLVTVGLWCANHALQPWTGEMGIIATLPLVLFFSTGVLSKDDFKQFPWDVVLLAMGGLGLGECVQSSGLLLTIAKAIGELVDGLGQWKVLVIFCAVVLICTTFISHTVGAIVILPIVQSVGESMPGGPHPKLLIMGAALMCSGAMGLPVSGFPNMNAVSLEDEYGNVFVSTWDFLTVGVPGSLCAYAVIVTLGYSLCRLVGF